MVNVLGNYSKLPPSNCTLLIDNVYSLTINNVIQSPTQTKPQKFDFYGSFYFSTTVVTTIGKQTNHKVKSLYFLGLGVQVLEILLPQLKQDAHSAYFMRCLEFHFA